VQKEYQSTLFQQKNKSLPDFLDLESFFIFLNT
jgi:hypothetical protein